MIAELLDSSAQAIAAAVGKGSASAREVVEAALDRIAARNEALGAFTDVTAARALKKAAAIDAARARGERLGSLAGAPFAVKNLFDVAGLPTRAGSKINRGRPPAPRDATLVRRLEEAGAVLVGALNMGEYAYDFTGQNVHDGPSRNPHDLGAMTGGSSGGSGAAVAGGLVPLALGSDTNGSIRVPSSFCGIFGLKPTYGRLSRAGTFPFVASLDHLGPFARSAGDLALSYDAMLGPDADDPAQAEVAPARRFAVARGGRRGFAHRQARRLFRPFRRAVRLRRRRCDRTGPEDGSGRRTRRGREGAGGGLSHHHGRRRGAASSAPADPRGGFRSRRARPAHRRRDAARRLGGAGAEVPAAVPGARRWRSSATSTSSSRRRRPAAR